MKTDSVDWIYNEIHKKNVFNKYWWNHQITCSKIVLLFCDCPQIYDCRVRLYMQSFTKVYLKVSTSLQSESTYKKKNKPLKKSHISPRYTQDSNQPVKDRKKSDQAGFHLDKPFIHTDWIQSFS